LVDFVLEEILGLAGNLLLLDKDLLIREREGVFLAVNFLSVSATSFSKTCATSVQDISGMCSPSVSRKCGLYSAGADIIRFKRE